jgi:hypothetical protein
MHPDSDWWRSKGVEWDFCHDCHTPYRMDDLVPVYEKGGTFYRYFKHFLCRWHAKRERERQAKAS